MQPFYIMVILGYEPTTEYPTPLKVAEIPLVTYTASIIVCFFFQRKLMHKFKNRLTPLFIGVVIVIIGTLPLLVLYIMIILIIFIFHISG